MAEVAYLWYGDKVSNGYPAGTNVSVGAIIKWMRDKESRGAVFVDLATGTRATSEAQISRIAYYIARKLNRDGYKGTGFLEGLRESISEALEYADNKFIDDYYFYTEESTEYVIDSYLKGF